MNSATLRLFIMAEQCHTQNFYLRCFKSDFDAVKTYLVYSWSRLRWQPQNEDVLKIEDDLKNRDNLKIEDNLEKWPSPLKFGHIKYMRHIFQ